MSRREPRGDGLRFACLLQELEDFGFVVPGDGCFGYVVVGHAGARSGRAFELERLEVAVVEQLRAGGVSAARKERSQE